MASPDPVEWKIEYYSAPNGEVPFRAWMSGLKDAAGRARIDARIARLRRFGQAGNCKAVGGGVIEMRVDAGPGYRIYFGKEAGDIVLLLRGGDKSTQSRDIATAQSYLRAFKRAAKKEQAGDAKARGQELH